jgi:hypothetical protein
MLSQVKAKWSCQARVHSNQMVLVAVRQEAGPVAQWLKMLKERIGKGFLAARGSKRKRAE